MKFLNENIRNRREMGRDLKSGFSVMELLVVSALIAILAGLLLLALAGAKGRAQRTVCLNNLKQLNVAVHLYAGESGDVLPNTGWNTYISYRDAVKGYVGLTGTNSPQDRVFACAADSFYYADSKGTYHAAGRHEQERYYYSSYVFNGLNLMGTNYPNYAYNGILPGIGGQKLGSLRVSTRTLLVLEAPAILPYSWHNPKPPGTGLHYFDGARNMVSFGDGHASYVGIYWNSTLRYPGNHMSAAAYYNPPASYDYQWSGN